MFSHAQTSRSHKSKNPKGPNEDSGGVNLTLCNPSKPQYLKTLFAPARQSREPTSSNDHDEIQEPTLKRTPMKLSVQPKKKTDNEYEKQADDNLHPFSQQPFQPVDHGLKEISFD